MHALHKLQQSFAADIWDEELVRLDGIVLDGRLPAQRLFQVYRNNFWISTEDALTGIYATVRKLVGDQFFSFMVDQFLRRFPPRHGDVQQLGHELPVFLCEFKPVAQLPYLPDIARLEWAYHEVFHAASASHFDADLLTKIPPEKIPQLKFDLAATSRLVYSPYPIFQIWRVNQPGFEGDQSVNLDSGDESILLTRPDLEVELHRLDQVDARFLQSLAAGMNLGAATQAAFKYSSDFNLEKSLARYLACAALTLSDSLIANLTNNDAGGK